VSKGCLPYVLGLNILSPAPYLRGLYRDKTPNTSYKLENVNPPVSAYLTAMLPPLQLIAVANNAHAPLQQTW